MNIFEIDEYKNAIRDIVGEMSINNAKVLVTGASGMIGSSLTDALIYANQNRGLSLEIFVLGRNKESLEERFGYDRSVKYIVQDVMDKLPDVEFDYIFHLASNADPVSYAKYPVETAMINIIGTKNLLDYCMGRKTRLLFTSSFEVYGKTGKDVFSENDYGVIDIDVLRNTYPQSKRMAEMLIKASVSEYGVNAVTARLSSVYGPTMKNNDSKAHAQFLRNAVKGEDIVLKSKGEQRRTYTNVFDAVSGLIAVMEKGKSGEAYNVGNGDSVLSIAELAGIIADLSGTKVVFELPDELESKGFSKPQNCILNTEKIEQLGWKAKYPIRDGLQVTLKMLKEN